MTLIYWTIKKSQMPEAQKKAKEAPSKKYRFVGWQNTPIHQATFGQTTRGGSKNTRFLVKHSTGDVTSIDAQTYVVDASKVPLGRMATIISVLLMGKHRPTFTPGAGSADSVVVINAEKTFLSSNKADKKIYYWHSHWMGGLKQQSAREALQTRPDEIIWEAVQGMLPKNKISRYALARLKIYKGSEHPHKAQKPIAVKTEGDALKRIGVGS